MVNSSKIFMVIVRVAQWQSILVIKSLVRIQHTILYSISLVAKR